MPALIASSSRKLVFAFLLGIPFLAVLAQAPKQQNTIVIGGGTYTVVDRVAVAQDSEFAQPFNGPISYHSSGDPCSGTDPAGGKGHDPFRIPGARSSGFSAALLKLRFVGPPPVGSQFYGGSLDVALFNPCNQPIAVPVIRNWNFAEYLPKDGKFDSRQLLLTFLLGAEGNDSVLRAGCLLVGTSSQEETYRILRPYEAVVLSIPLHTSATTMPQRDFERLLPTARITASYGSSYWNAGEQLWTDGVLLWGVPSYNSDLRVEIAK